jgi:uncharacterized protein YheU (UPF0270 family)
MIIPIDALEADTLYSLAESFVLVYSELHESVDIKRKEDIQPSDTTE